MRSVPASWRQSSSSVSCCRDGRKVCTPADWADRPQTPRTKKLEDHSHMGHRLAHRCAGVNHHLGDDQPPTLLLGQTDWPGEVLGAAASSVHLGEDQRADLAHLEQCQRCTESLPGFGWDPAGDTFVSDPGQIPAIALGDALANERALGVSFISRLRGGGSWPQFSGSRNPGPCSA